MINIASTFGIRQSHINILVFLFFFLVMLSTNGGHLDPWDGKGYFLLTQNIVKHQSLILQPDLVIPGQENSEFNTSSYFSWVHSLRNDGRSLPINTTLQPMPGLGSPLFASIGVPFYLIAEVIDYSP